MGGTLIEARFDVARALNLRGMVAGSLIADYHMVADEMSVEQYVQDVITGKRFDSNLSKQLRKGFQVSGLIPGYTIADSSCGWGVEIIWHNPDYQPHHILRKWIPTRPYTTALKPAHIARPAYRGA